MSLLAKGVLAFTGASYAQELPIPSETTKMIISGIFSLASVGIVELFKYLKGRRAARKTNQTNVEQPIKAINNLNESREVPSTADSL